jgi:RNA polymerase sigma-70 factor, ECF subfamily
LNESELIQRCKAGDRQAQKDLYERSVSRIYGLLLKLTANEHDALDLAQDTYIRAFQRIDQFDQNSAITTWLYRIAYNEALQFLKAEARRKRKTEMFVQRTGYLRADESSSTSRGFDDEPGNIRAEMATALSSLSTDEQAILLLRYHEGLDYRQLAEVLECSPGTVASRLNRARGRLGTILEKRHRTLEER